MKINKFVITIFFSAVGLFASTALWAQEAKTLFVNMPDSLSPLLTKVNREDCIDFLESKMKAQVENRFGKKSEMTDLSKDYIRMQMSSQSTWQMKVLALNDSTNVICTVSTACAPACDSSIRFYTDDWKPLTASLYITLPVMGDFLNTPDSAGVYEFDEARRSADILLMKADFNKENTELTVTLATPDYMSRETETVSPPSDCLSLEEWSLYQIDNSPFSFFLYSQFFKQSLMNAIISGVLASTL